MNLQVIFSIFKKELLELIRDKRTLFLLILLPFFLYPVLFTVLGKVGAAQGEKLDNEVLDVWVNIKDDERILINTLKEESSLNLIFKEFEKAQLDTLDKVIGLKIESSKLLDTLVNYEATIYANQTSDLVKTKKSMIRKALEKENRGYLKNRLKQYDLDSEFTEPIEIREVELADVSELIGSEIGGFIPVMILLFIFIGCIYIAIDITAGEKERKTLQTLYTAPVKTSEIIGGKFLSVLLVAVVSGFMNLSSLLFAVYIQTKLLGAGDIFKGFQLDLGATEISLLALMIILVAIFIAALTLAIVLLANSYKEAQSYVSPLMFVVLIPGIIATLPGMEFTTQTAFVPMLNVVLAMGELFKGNYNLNLILLVVLFQLLYAGIALFLASKIFGNESVITGEKVKFQSIFKTAK